MPRSIELLAPARNLECGIEAIRHGADAVYIGASRFGARAAAGNSVEDIARLVAFARPFGARVYVTVNTLLYDDELPSAQQLVDALAAIPVDALIVQDPRIRDITHRPGSPSASLPLHASTQMDNRTIEDVRARLSEGYTQTVLARELSLDDIRAIHAAVPEMPLEAFVHGALCVSYSGRCYASEYCFGRSANRGECAQFCRLPFDLIDADGRIVTDDHGAPQRQLHLLSLKDMNRSADLEAMMDAGISSFKIEGRLKDVDYVKNLTAFYRQRLDAILARRPSDYCRASHGTSTITFTPDPLKSFNRGFTDYFLHGRTPTPIYQPLTPKSLGEPVGHVKDVSAVRYGKDASAGRYGNEANAVRYGNDVNAVRHGKGASAPSLAISGLTTFSNGDGLCFFTSDGRLQGFRVNRIDAHGRLYPADPSVLTLLRKGTALYRNQDAAFARLLARPTADRRLPVAWLLEETSDGFRLTLSRLSETNGNPLTLSRLSETNGAPAHPLAAASFVYPNELARSPQADNIRRQLLRLGDTPYTCSEEHVTLHLTNNWFLPSSVLADWRRAVVQQSIPSFPSTTDQESSPSDNDSSSSCSVPSPRRDTSVPQVLMTCRHCLRYALGYCTRDHHPLPFREPLSLRLSDGRTFPLHFDCARCEMRVMKNIKI